MPLIVRVAAREFEVAARLFLVRVFLVGDFTYSILEDTFLEWIFNFLSSSVFPRSYNISWTATCNVPFPFHTRYSNI